MEKPTIGPWQMTGESTHGTYFKVRGTMPGGKWEIANCPYLHTDDVDYGRNEAEANARLIAAAPAMLEALRTIFKDSLGDYRAQPQISFSYAELDEIVKLIRTAEGESHV